MSDQVDRLTAALAGRYRIEDRAAGEVAPGNTPMTSDVERLTAALADRYRIDREIGAGGMATVFLARDLKHDRLVALKVLDPELGAVLVSSAFSPRSG